MNHRLKISVCLMLFATLVNADAPPASEPGRGELLYTTHCTGCHSVQVHWRQESRATDWASLQAEVRRWESASGLGWNDRDVAEVAGYLNRLHYHFTLPESRAGLDQRR